MGEVRDLEPYARLRKRIGSLGGPDLDAVGELITRLRDDLEEAEAGRQRAVADLAGDVRAKNIIRVANDVLQMRADVKRGIRDLAELDESMRQLEGATDWTEHAA